MNRILYTILISLQLNIILQSASAISPNDVETEIAEMAVNHSSQQRPEMVYDPILNLVARAKAIDLAERGYFAHVDPDGYGPNKAVTLAGYEFPAWWGSDNDANYIESIAAGYSDASSAFDGWMNSPGHRSHILGEIEFFAEQTRYGVGYANIPGSPYQKYYVFISAPPNLGGDQQLDPYVEWLFTFYTLAQIDSDGDASDTNNNGVPRIIEFALGFNPNNPSQLPMPVVNTTTQSFEWALPVRENLGSVNFEVQYSDDLSTGYWSADHVDRNGSVFSTPFGTKGFMRLRAFRQ